MDKEEIIAQVKSLNLPQGSYVVCGSCPLAIAGLRQAQDIDLLVSPKVLQDLKLAGWKQVNKAPNDKPYTNGVFEADSGRDFSAYGPSLDEFLKTATIVEGVPFASLYHVRRWKAISDRPKDQADVKLIDKYISEHTTDSDRNTMLVAWTAYTDTITNWQELVAGTTPLATDCGPIYELPNPIDRSNESFTIADMRSLGYSGPHYHKNDETEIYIVLTGTGRVFVGDAETAVLPGSVIIIPPYMSHFVIPTNDLVIAAVNTPPFDVANTVPILKTDLSVGFDQDKFALLTRSLR